MKSLSKLLAELDETRIKSDKRLLEMEKGMYSHWRSAKLRAIDHARTAKSIGWKKSQLFWQQQAAKYDSWAKESKKKIWEYGSRIYKSTS